MGPKNAIWMLFLLRLVQCLKQASLALHAHSLCWRAFNYYYYFFTQASHLCHGHRVCAMASELCGELRACCHGLRVPSGFLRIVSWPQGSSGFLRMMSQPQVSSGFLRIVSRPQNSCYDCYRCWMHQHCRTTSTSIWWTGQPRMCWRWAWAPASTCGRHAPAKSPSCVTSAAASPRTACAPFPGARGGPTCRWAPTMVKHSCGTWPRSR